MSDSMRKKMLAVTRPTEVDMHEKMALQIAHVHGAQLLIREGLKPVHFTDPRGRLFQAQIIASKEAGGPPALVRVLELLSATADSGLSTDEARSLVFESAVFDALEQHAGFYTKAIITAWAEREKVRWSQELQRALENGDPEAEAIAFKRLDAIRRSGTGADALPLLSLDDILNHVPDPTDAIWPGGLMQAGDPTALIGAPGAGKSRLSLQSAVATIIGRPFLGFKTNAPGKRWLFLQTENSIDRLQFDLGRMVAVLTPGERDAVKECLRIVKISALDGMGICMTDGHPDRERIAATVNQFQPRIVAIDPMRDAGRGDLNTDVDMTAAVLGISSLIRHGDPKRTPLVIHHGRTGAAEAQKVFGGDAGSFARNSKVLLGWLRSQINVAAAGPEHEGVIILGCGKNSNGKPWAPFAARLDEQTMTYERLEESEFDLEEWADSTGRNGRKSSKIPKVGGEEVAALFKRHGSKLSANPNVADSFPSIVRREFRVTKEAAMGIIDDHLGTTLQYVDEPRSGLGRGTSGGKPARYYVLKGEAA